MPFCVVSPLIKINRKKEFMCFDTSPDKKNVFIKNEHVYDDLLSLPLPPQLPENEEKMTVVLDMDETLLHSVFLNDNITEIRDNTQSNNKQHNLSGTLESDKELAIHKRKTAERNADIFFDTYGGVAVFFRPGLHRFLFKLSKLCEVVLWTAAEREYAEPILDEIDPYGDLLPYRLYKEHTIQQEDQRCVKDLQLLGRNLKRTVLIDNNTLVEQTSPSNCVIIKDFYDDQNDQELQVIFKLICKINELVDIRPSLKKILKSSYLLDKQIIGEKVCHIVKQNDMKCLLDCFSEKEVQPWQLTHAVYDTKKKSSPIPNTYRSDVKEVFPGNRKRYSFFPVQTHAVCDTKKKSFPIPNTYRNDVKEVFSGNRKRYSFLPVHQKSVILSRDISNGWSTPPG